MARARLADFPHGWYLTKRLRPLEWKFDNWARAHRRHRSQARPLPGKVCGGPPSLFIGFHGTDDSGLLAILQTNGGQLKPGPASWGGNYVFVKGFLAYGSGSEDGRQASSDEARRILRRIYEKSSMHACGVVIEVSMLGVHKTCRTVAGEWDWAGKATLLHTGQGPYWLEVDYALGGRRCPCVVVDLSWPWEPSDSWLF